MTEIKTWRQRCEENPDLPIGMLWYEGVIARMCEEIEELRAEIERLRARAEHLEREMRFIGRLDYPPTRLSARDRARAALEAKP
jgi:predicted RNase H-like nuclease (RuvC/YqgF family)